MGRLVVGPRTVAVVGGGAAAAVVAAQPWGGGQVFLSGDVVVGPDHGELFQLCDAGGVHVAAGLEAAGVGGPLP